MNYLKQLVAPACCLTLITVSFSTTLRTADWNRKTVVIFSGPVEVPGVHAAGWSVLPAGAYVFKIMDSPSDRHIVQNFSKDEKTVYATVLASPNDRLQATDKTVINFSERAAGEPEALRAWFYPGRGEEFVYPKGRVMALAKATNTPVLFTPAELPAEVSEPIQSADSPVVAELKRAPIKAVQSTGEEVELTQVGTPPLPEPESPVTQAEVKPAAEKPALMAQLKPAAGTATAAVATADRSSQGDPAATLPMTSTRLPQIAAIGFLALASALA